MWKEEDAADDVEEDEEHDSEAKDQEPAHGKEEDDEQDEEHDSEDEEDNSEAKDQEPANGEEEDDEQDEDEDEEVEEKNQCHSQVEERAPKATPMPKLKELKPTEKQLAIQQKINQAVQAAYRRNGPAKPVEESEVKEEWTIACEGMSCYYGNEGYGTGWDP